MENEVKTKRCNACGDEFPASLEYFHRQRRFTFGIRKQRIDNYVPGNKCKWCTVAYQAGLKVLPGALNTLTGKHLRDQFRRQKGLCYYCGCEMTRVSHTRLTACMEHVVPISRGGDNSLENVVISCASCNNRKNNKRPHEWAGSNRLL
jgi:CRISPR/Cas system Type II protein with McrA/HNH and RuvC-like nuclease domain